MDLLEFIEYLKLVNTNLQLNNSNTNKITIDKNSGNLVITPQNFYHGSVEIKMPLS
jgi:hypothetical protein